MGFAPAGGGFGVAGDIAARFKNIGDVPLGAGMAEFGGAENPARAFGFVFLNSLAAEVEDACLVAGGGAVFFGQLEEFGEAFGVLVGAGEAAGFAEGFQHDFGAVGSVVRADLHPVDGIGKAFGDAEALGVELADEFDGFATAFLGGADKERVGFLGIALDIAAGDEVAG